jgi:hypothetical protein
VREARALKEGVWESRALKEGVREARALEEGVRESRVLKEGVRQARVRKIGGVKRRSILREWRQIPLKTIMMQFSISLQNGDMHPSQAQLIVSHL